MDNIGRGSDGKKSLVGLGLEVKYWRNVPVWTFLLLCAFSYKSEASEQTICLKWHLGNSLLFCCSGEEGEGRLEMDARI